MGIGDKNKFRNRGRCIVQVLASSKLGGGELVAIQAAKYLKGTDRLCEAWVPMEGAAFEFLSENRIPFRTLPFLTEGNCFSLKNLRSLLKLHNALRSVNPVLMHFHSPFVYRAFSRFKRMRRCVSIVHVHAQYDKPTLRWCLRTAPTAVIVCASFMQTVLEDVLLDLGISNTHVFVLRNAVDVDRFAIRNKGFGLPRRDCKILKILMLANLAPFKGQEIAIRTLYELKKVGIDAELHFAGIDREGTGYENTLKKLASGLGLLEQVRFLGFRSDPEVLLGNADFLMLPSINEGLPLSILEAQASGVPVLANPTGGIPEVVRDGETGFLISSNAPEDYANCILEMISQPALYEKVLRQSRDYIRHCHSDEEYHLRLSSLYDYLSLPRQNRPSGFVL